MQRLVKILKVRGYDDDPCKECGAECKDEFDPKDCFESKCMGVLGCKSITLALSQFKSLLNIKLFNKRSHAQATALLTACVNNTDNQNSSIKAPNPHSQ